MRGRGARGQGIDEAVRRTKNLIPIVSLEVAELEHPNMLHDEVSEGAPDVVVRYSETLDRRSRYVDLED